MKPTKFSARTILISLVVLNFIAIGLSEIQRRALVETQVRSLKSFTDKIEAVVPQLDQSLRNIDTRLQNVELAVGLKTSPSSTEPKITGTPSLAGYEADNLFSDGPRGWEISGQQGWVGYELRGSALKCKSYSMIAARDWIDRAPRDWTFEGSEDGQTWTMLDSQKNQQWVETNPIASFKINCPRAYRYFRWTILKNGGGPSVILQRIVLE